MFDVSDGCGAPERKITPTDGPSSLHRQGEGNRRAFVFLAAQGDSAVMLFDDVLDDSQAQAGPFDFAGPAGIGPVKAFKDTRLFVFRDTDTGVTDNEDRFMTLMADMDIDMAAWPVVLDGIV